MLIVFEGIDGSGKNTQIAKLLSFLRQHGLPYSIHKYPTLRAKEVFAHLSGRKTVPPLELAGIFANDIAGEQEKIRREMALGKIVICDRYLQSTLAYQAVGAGYQKTKALLSTYPLLVPDIVILLDVDQRVSSARKRKQKKPDRHEKDSAFLSKVRANYLRMMRGHFLSYKYARVDAAGSQEEIFSEVITLVEPFITGFRKNK